MTSKRRKAKVNGETPSVSVVLPVLVRHPWQLHLTEAAIKIMRCTTAIPFQIVVVETESRTPKIKSLADVYEQVPKRTTAIRDYNRAIDLATGEFIVHTANDILVQPGWLEALLKPFAIYPDCGASTIAIREAGGLHIGQTTEQTIVEGMYGPIMMFRKGWRFDEDWEFGADGDLIMRMYVHGLRAYRCLEAMAYHLHMATWNAEFAVEQKQKEQEYQQRWEERWGNSPLWMAKVIQNGAVVFGHEHERVGVRMA